MNMKKFTIQKTASIKSALEKIDSNAEGIVCVLDNSKKVIGIATDGDIRRKLLKSLNR